MTEVHAADPHPDAPNDGTTPLALQQQRKRRWRLVLGDPHDAGLDQALALSKTDKKLDQALTFLYGPHPQEGAGGTTATVVPSAPSASSGTKREGGLAPTALQIHRWLGDIRRYFPAPVVQVVQKDAFERFGIQVLVSSPELLESIQPDVHLVATILSYKDLIPEQTKQTARQVVRRLVDLLIEKLANSVRQAILGGLDRIRRTRRPSSPNAIDWNRTIRANLKNYQDDYRTVIPEVVFGFPRKQRHVQLKHVILCVDQSGSMAESVVYAGILGSVIASLPAVRTSMVVFDTSVVDLTAELRDPVDLLFGVQLGGGTDIGRALGYVQKLINRPEDTILVLISDLYEGGSEQLCQQRVVELVQAGVQMIALLALDDRGQPQYNHGMARFMVQQGVPCLACTPSLFPELMAAAIQRQDLSSWAAAHKLPTLQKTAPGPT
ncbi:MAG: VWA domain-containing protein [Gemmataceae bacterium]|nr:VWA domain-containing protein [Gemmataceae bacterium]MCS7270369.1 VWA domain-containing protein [Gemmataceae bacterium]MDW8241748.1 VWA domain-containing protein [Thermogemmata sp.]